MRSAQLNRLLVRLCGWSLLLDGLSQAVPVGAGWPVQGHAPYADLPYNLLVWSVALVVAVVSLRCSLGLMDRLAARLYRNAGPFGPRGGLFAGLAVGFLIIARIACGEASELAFPPARAIHAFLGFCRVHGTLTYLGAVTIHFAPWGFLPSVVLGVACLMCVKLWPSVPPPRSQGAVALREVSDIVWWTCGFYVLARVYEAINPFLDFHSRALNAFFPPTTPFEDFPWHAFAGEPMYWTPGRFNPIWWWLPLVVVGLGFLGPRRSWRPFFLGPHSGDRPYNGDPAPEHQILLGGIGLLLLTQSLTELVQFSCEIPAMYVAGLGPVFLSQGVPLGWLVLLSRLALGIALSARIPLRRRRLVRDEQVPAGANMGETTSTP